MSFTPDYTLVIQIVSFLVLWFGLETDLSSIRWWRC